ncbi:MAG: hypothetical protein ABIS01_17835 [Ferruginibacter sp.]
MQEEIIENLISKYFEGKASVDEIDQLDKWYNSFDFKTEVLYVPGTGELNRAVVKGFSELKLKLGIEGVLPL